MGTAGIAIIYHPHEGRTAEVADHIASRVRLSGIPADIFECCQAPPRLRDYRGLMVGGSIHSGHHHKELEQFVRARKAELDHLPNAFFSVGINAGAQANTRRTRALDAVSRFIAETGWHPDLVSLVGGAIAYTRYGFIKRRLLQKLGAEIKRPGAAHDHEYTDWAALDQFTDDFIAHVQPPPIPHSSYRDSSTGN